MDATVQIRDFVRETFAEGAGNGTFSDDSSLVETGIIDSLGIVKMISFIETTFGFKVREQDIVPEYFENIRAIASYVEQHRQTA